MIQQQFFILSFILLDSILYAVHIDNKKILLCLISIEKTSFFYFVKCPKQPESDTSKKSRFLRGLHRKSEVTQTTRLEQ